LADPAQQHAAAGFEHANSSSGVAARAFTEEVTVLRALIEKVALGADVRSAS
jgi:hypothetical protein